MSGGGDEDTKPNTGGDHINLKVKGQDGNEVFFRIKRSTQLKKLMNAYCDRQSVEINSIAFLFDGRRLRAEQTPDELEMEEGDEIDAMLHQTGGGGGDVPNTGDEGARITLKVKVLQEATATIQDLVGRVKHLELDEKIDQGCNEAYFWIKRNTRLKKLMYAYCERQSVELNSIAFMFNGQLLRGEQTPHELEMEEGDEIYALHFLTGGGGDEDKKPNAGDQGAYINLKVNDQVSKEDFFRIKRSMQLKKLMNAYCDRQSVKINKVSFTFDGLRLRGEETPDELEMNDGDEIYAMHIFP